MDHFFPWSKRYYVSNVNGVWNLVLTCPECSLSKEAQIPAIHWLKQLHIRNEYLISSHHPLRETIIHQTGTTEEQRAQFLQNAYNTCNIGSGWMPKIKGSDIF